MGSVTVEGRGRISIPKELREKLGIRGGEKLRVEERNGEIVLRPEKSGESLKQLEGIVEESEIDPMDVKRIWRE
ncbi:MAG: AbrB/MazE/SpoVT family DNA-binding domain-containing protein [Candidatus Nanohaloarchaea archaeon]